MTEDNSMKRKYSKVRARLIHLALSMFQ